MGSCASCGVQGQRSSVRKLRDARNQKLCKWRTSDDVLLDERCLQENKNITPNLMVSSCLILYIVFFPSLNCKIKALSICMCCPWCFHVVVQIASDLLILLLLPILWLSQKVKACLQAEIPPPSDALLNQNLWGWQSDWQSSKMRALFFACVGPNRCFL